MITVNADGHKIAVMAHGDTEEIMWELGVATAQLHLKYMKESHKTEANIRRNMTKWGELIGDLMLKMASEEGRANILDLSSDVMRNKAKN